MRALTNDSVMVLLRGARASGVFQEPGVLPVVQPNDERGFGFAQIASFQALTYDPVESLQIIFFQVGTNQITPEYAPDIPFGDWR